MSVKSIRVSKTSFKAWSLYGPVDQALKTSIQAEAVKVFPLKVCVHGDELHLALWINAEEMSSADDESNAPATLILQQQELRNRGLDEIPLGGPETDDGTGMHIVAAQLMDGVPLVQGPAIITGAGGDDIPGSQENSLISVDCVLSALVGTHGE